MSNSGHSQFNGLDWSLLVKHLAIKDIHNPWLFCFTNPLELWFTSCLPSVKITFSELLYYCHFVWMKAKFFVKDSSQSAVRNSQDSCTFASKTSGRTQKRLPHRLNACIWFRLFNKMCDIIWSLETVVFKNLLIRHTELMAMFSFTNHI